MTSAAEGDDFVLVEKKDGVMTITLNRAAQGNAIRVAMYGSIADALIKAAKDDDVEVVIITGKGKFFSTGADVSEAAERVMKGEGLDELEPSFRKYPVALTKAMIEFPKVLVAAVNGPVIGYPAAQLGLYDLVFVSDAATYQVPLLHLGLAPEGCASFTLQRTVGRALANDLLITGRTLSANEMVAFGIASRVFPAATFHEDVLHAVTAGCSACASSSMLASKRLLLATYQERMSQQNEKETIQLIKQFQSGEPMDRFAKKFMEMRKAAKAAGKAPGSKL